ncbi:MAG: AraC family transcriptional regulator [Gemmatimonadales bacterium]
MTRGITVERAQTSLGAIELFSFERHHHAFPRHAHDVLTLGALGPDNGTIRVMGGAYRAVAGALLALAPDQVHSAEPLGQNGWTYRSLCPSPTLLAAALGSEQAFAFDRPVIADPASAEEVAALHRTLACGPPTLATELRLVDLLRSVVGRHASGRDLQGEEAATPCHAAAVTRARDLLEAHYSRSVRLAELARECGISLFQLVRAFHAAFGTPPHAYLMQVRVRRARTMLLRGEAISRVAFACGFVDQSHLTRVFKRHFGLTPGAYRRD